MKRAYPLSPLQHGMLFQGLYERHPGVDLVQIGGDLHERLNVGRFHAAWLEAVGRHDALRTSISLENPETPTQEVHPEVALPWVEEDWTELQKEARDARWAAFLHGDRMRGFDLSQPPLLRITVVRWGGSQWRFCLTFHHIILDETALYGLFDEVFARYDTDEARPVRVQFHEYIAWHQQQDWTKAEPFWRQELRGLRRATSMPLAAPQAHWEEHRGAAAAVQVEISPRTTRALEGLAELSGVTLHTVFQAAWALLVSRITAEEDVLFGVTRRCRKSHVPGAETIVGLLVNTVPFRVAVSPDATVQAWLQQLRQRWVAMRDFENTPLLLIQGWSEIPPGERLFSTILNFLQPCWDRELLSRGGPWRKRSFTMAGQADYYLTLDVFAGNPTMGLRMAYDDRRMTQAAVAQLLAQFQTLLTNLAAHPSVRLGEVSMMTPAELKETTVAWNRTAVKYPRHATVAELYAEQTKRTPQAIALRWHGKSLTYQQLEHRANRVARSLLARSLRPGALVALCLERGVDLITGMLAIYKLGGVCVPLDPSLPSARIEQLLLDSGVVLVMTHEKFQARLPTHATSVHCLDTAWAAAKLLSREPLPAVVRGEDPACVFYTSGSAGPPKGVVIPHRAIVRLVRQQRYAHFGPGERFLQFAPVSFDAASFEIWGALLNGSTLVVASPGLLSLADLGELIVREEISVLWLTTGLFIEMIEHASSYLGNVRQVLTGGSVMPPATMVRARRELPDCRITHCYGPTENGTFTSSYEVPRTAHLPNPIPIGRAIANTTIYVLDKQLRPVPVGVPGELYTGGDGLALGYLHAPELTAEKFIPDPFQRDPQARLYRTGDIVRWRAEGDLEFIGRRDQQVKIRGFRVEPGEIAQVLTTHPDVAQAFVEPRQEADGSLNLHAWYELHPNADERTEVLGFLRSRLPTFMLPTTLHRVPSMPLKANGKVDPALLTTEALMPSATSYQATATEQRVRAIFSATLGIPAVGVQDDFFALGGHSLKAMRLVAMISEEFGVPLPVRTLFSAPTVFAIAQWLDTALIRQLNQHATLGDHTLVAIRAGAAGPPLFLIPGGWGGENEILVLARLARLLPAAHPCYALCANVVRQAAATVPEIARIFLQEIRAVHPHGPVWLVGECIAGSIAWEMAYQLQQEMVPVRLILLDAWCPTAQRMDDIPLTVRTALSGELRLYYEALLNYAPSAYEGDVHLIASATSLQRNQTLGWTEIRPGQLHILPVPGNHESYLRAEVAHTGQTLSALLDSWNPNSIQ